MPETLSSLSPARSYQDMKGDSTMRIQEDLRSVRSLKPLDKKAAEAKAQEVAEDFESVFLSQMLEHMFAGIETDEMFGGGHAEDVYRSLLIDEYGKLIAKAGGIGIADHVKREMLTLQEVE